MSRIVFKRKEDNSEFLVLGLMLGPRKETKQELVDYINSGGRVFMTLDGEPGNEVYVKDGYLTTHPDEDPGNNLEDLPTYK